MSGVTQRQRHQCRNRRRRRDFSKIDNIDWDGFCREPKEVSEIEKETHRFTPPGFRRLFEWWGMSKDAAKRIDNTNPLEDKLAALDQKLDQSINNLNEKMNDIIELLKRI